MPTVLPRILVVDHEETAVAALKEELPRLGYRVAGVARSGNTAVRLAERFFPDLALVNLQLAGEMDGIRTAGEFHRRQIPVVYTATHADDETCGRARAGGPFGLLVKPFEAQELHAALSTALLRHESLQEAFENRSLLQTALKSTQDGIIAVNSRGQVRFVSPAAETITCWQEAEAAGKPIEEVYPLLDLHRKPVRQHPIRRALETGFAQKKARFVLVCRDGRELLVEGVAAPLRDMREEISGALVVFCDVTERIRLEEFQRQERARLEQQVARTAEALGTTRAELQALISRGITVLEDERRRVARELHDDLGQRVAFLQFEAERLRQYAKVPEIRSGLIGLIEETTKFSSALRELSHRLHPSMLEDLGLTAALRSLVEDYRKQGMDITLGAGEIPGSASLEVRTVLYRIAQEALRNAWKHVPAAAVYIRLLEEDGHLKLIIEDTGPGFDISRARAEGGLGLLSMQERARLVGGSFFLNSDPEDGTTLVVRVPRGAEELDGLA